MKLIKQFAIALIPFSLFGVDYRDFNEFQNKFTKQELEFRIQNYLQKDKEISQYFTLTDEALFLYASPVDQVNQCPEYTLSLSKNPDCLTSTSLHPPIKGLKGLRIAIDPGHLGGEYAVLEERFILMTPNGISPISEKIEFNEGTLTLLTAKLLKILLEKEGAQVLLTREYNGCSVYEQDFFSWLKEFKGDPSASLSTLFRKYYTPLDLRARADKINAFHPHLTLIIHYNIDKERDLLTQENTPTLRNYNMAFIGGGFCQGELKEKENRYHFLRLLLTEHLDLSICLSEEVLKSFSSYLHVSAVKEEDSLPYLKRTSLYIKEGLYARNLVLTRLIRGPLCYGETFCQDHVTECQLLNAKDLIIDGVVGPKRVWSVAYAYFNAIKSFIR